MTLRSTALPFLLLFSLLISSCAATPTLPPTPEIVTIYSTAAAEPWLSELYNCAQASPVLERIDDPNSAQIALRIGEPKVLPFAYQIDTEEILIVTHRQSPVQNLSGEEARGLFSGQGDPSVQVWYYGSGNDVQEVFNQFVMEGRSFSASVRTAASPQQMSDTLVNETNSVGILPAHWKVGDTRVVYTIPNVPVLAMTLNEPQGSVKELIACLQK